MASVRDQVYAVAAADTGAGGVVTLLGSAAQLLGGPLSAPPPAGRRPYLYLQFDAEVPWAPLGPPQQGVFRWRGYDDEHAGYRRLGPLLARLRVLYAPYRRMGTRWHDAATGEDIYWLDEPLRGPETEDAERHLLQQWVEWPYRITRRWAAA